MNLINNLKSNYKNISQNDAFWQEMHDNFLRSSRVVVGVIVAMIAPIIIEDWLSYRDLFPALLMAKLLCIAMLVSGFLLIRTDWGKRYAETIIVFSIFIVIIASVYQVTLIREPFLLTLIAVFGFMISATVFSWPLPYHIAFVGGFVAAVWISRLFINPGISTSIVTETAATLISLVSTALAYYTTERRFALWQAEASLRESEARSRQHAHESQQARATFSTVLNNLDALIYVADMQTYKILFANTRLRQEFDNIGGRICWQVLQQGQDGPCDFCSNPNLVTENGEPAGIVRWQFQNTRNRRWYALADSAIEWVDERLVRLSMAFDVTENKQAEAQLLAQQRLVAAMDERERVGRDLHDDLGQVMGYVNVQAQAAQDLLAQGRSEQTSATLSQLQAVAQEARNKVRQYILGIRTAHPTAPLDFWQALEQYLNKLRQRYGLQVHVDCPDALHDNPLAPDVETQLLHIIQESLTNVCKHAEIPSARLVFTLHPDEVQILIIDEGHGFDVQQHEPLPGGSTSDGLDLRYSSQDGADHLGLTIMRERAEGVGGSLDVQSQPGAGTRIIARLPRVLEVDVDENTRGLRVLLVDDHELYLKGLHNLLSTRGVHVVGLAHDGLQAQDMARELLPDLILMDVQMPHCNGLQAMRCIKAELPQVRIVMLTVADDDETLFEALKSGADGYLLKGLEIHQFFTLLTQVMRGDSVLSPALANRVLTEFTRSESPPAAPDKAQPPTLTTRQREVLELAAQGLTNKEIAQQLHVSAETVKTHVSQILKRLQLRSRHELTRYARE